MCPVDIIYVEYKVRKIIVHCFTNGPCTLRKEYSPLTQTKLHPVYMADEA